MKNIDLGKIKDISVNDIGGTMSRSWQRFYKLVLVIFWILLISAGAYKWYSIFYGPRWDEAEKTNFLKSKFPENNLNKDKLEKVLKEIDSKKDKFNQEVFDAKNIFKSY